MARYRVAHMLPDEHSPPCGVAIGASAGGVQALRTIVAALPVDLPAAVFVVLHLEPDSRSFLPMLLARATRPRVRDVREEAAVETSSVYVAVPDRHLLIVDGRVRLDSYAPVHHVRPSAGRLFESIALQWFTAAIGVVLTGNGREGASGIAAIKRGGGRTIAQDPSNAAYPGMRNAAIATGLVDAVLRLPDIGPAVARAAAVAAAARAAG
jgi:two-component system, chemotaxis family, protein-glutamate methylesterase/glutaminase